MASRALRLYVAATTLLVFFVLWAVVAAKPWASTTASHGLDPQLVALNRRQRRLQQEARAVKQTLDRRWRQYQARLRHRQAQIRALERQHAASVAAAQAAASTSAYAAASAAPAASTPSARVVTLPPQVKVVTLPPAAAPATSSGSSHP